jgi:hypothetical protein
MKVAAQIKDRTPAQAGVQSRNASDLSIASPNWTPAFAGVRKVS